MRFFHFYWRVTGAQTVPLPGYHVVSLTAAHSSRLT